MASIGLLCFVDIEYKSTVNIKKSPILYILYKTGFFSYYGISESAICSQLDLFMMMCHYTSVLSGGESQAQPFKDSTWVKCLTSQFIKS